MTFEEIEKNETIRAYISKADESLVALGYTEHSFAHGTHVAAMAGYLLETLGYDAHTVELAKIAGYLHDIGNLVNRIEHSQSGAVMAFQILTSLGFGAEDVATIVTAIRNQDTTTFDIHDRVNYSVKKSTLKINEDRTLVKLKLTVDTHFGSVMDYFEIFMQRMILCRKAAEKLGLQFKLIINEQQLI